MSVDSKNFRRFPLLSTELNISSNSLGILDLLHGSSHFVHFRTTFSTVSGRSQGSYHGAASLCNRKEDFTRVRCYYIKPIARLDLISRS